MSISLSNTATFANELLGDLIVSTSNNTQRLLLGTAKGDCNAMVSISSNSANVAGTVNAEDLSTYTIQTTDIYLTTYDPRNSNTLQVVEPYYQADTFTLNLSSYASNAANYASNIASQVDPSVSQYASNVGTYASNLTPKTVFASNAAAFGSNLTPKLDAASNTATWASNTAKATGDWATISGSNLGFNYATTLKGTTMANGAIVPTADSEFDLGTAARRFRSLYVSGNTIYIGSNALSTDTTTGSFSIVNSVTNNPVRLIVDQVQVGSAEGSNTVILKANATTGAIQFVSASVSNGLAVENSNSTSTTFDSNVPLEATFGSNAGAFGSNLGPAVQFASNAASAGAGYASNTAVFGSNTAVFASNLKPAVDFGSNTAAWSSNAIFNPAVSNITISGNIQPTQNHVQSIGTSNNRFAEAYIDTLYIASNTLYVGGVAVLQTAADTIIVSADVDQSVNVKTIGTGRTLLTSVAGVDMSTSGLNSTIVMQASGAGGRAVLGANSEVTVTAPLLNISSNVSVGGALTAGSLTVSGTTTFNGSNFIVNAQTVEVQDNIMLLNKGQTGSGVSAGQAGIRIDRGDATDYMCVFTESDLMFQVGAIGSLETIATRPYVVTNACMKTSNLSDVQNPLIARNNLGLGTSCNVTFSDVTATSYSGLVTTTSNVSALTISGSNVLTSNLSAITISGSNVLTSNLSAITISGSNVLASNVSAITYTASSNITSLAGTFTSNLSAATVAVSSNLYVALPQTGRCMGYGAVIPGGATRWYKLATVIEQQSKATFRVVGTISQVHDVHALDVTITTDIIATAIFSTINWTTPYYISARHLWGYFDLVLVTETATKVHLYARVAPTGAALMNLDVYCQSKNGNTTDLPVFYPPSTFFNFAFAGTMTSAVDSAITGTPVQYVVSTNANTRMVRTNELGYLGVGTSNPSSMLHVAEGVTASNVSAITFAGSNVLASNVSAIAFTGSNVLAVDLRVSNANTGAAVTASFYHNTLSNNHITVAIGKAAIPGATGFLGFRHEGTDANTSNRLRLGIWGSTTELTFGNNGHMGIGAFPTFIPQAPIHVGTFNAAGASLITASNATIGGSVLPAADNTQNIGSLTSRWNTIYAGVGTINTSDEADKDMGPLVYGLEELMHVSTIKYKWKTQADLPADHPDKNHEYYGLCAGELNGIFPELIYNTQRPYQLNYSELIPVMINAIKQLKTELIELRAATV
jgi:hypothetical protein